jgi:putative transposase
VAILAYCFMPDHFHSVVRLDGPSNLIDVIRLFKGRTTRIASGHNLPRKFWQSSFYDHIIRADESPEKYVRYVVENPVRAQLVETVNEFPFVGSFEYEVSCPAELLW